MRYRPLERFRAESFSNAGLNDVFRELPKTIKIDKNTGEDLPEIPQYNPGRDLNGAAVYWAIKFHGLCACSRNKHVACSVPLLHYATRRIET